MGGRVDATALLLGFVLGLPAGLVGGRMVWLWVTWPSPVTSVVTAQKQALLRPGMTKAEVEEVLGRPPGDYSRLPSGFRMPSYVQIQRRELLTWNDDNAALAVLLREDGTVHDS